MTSWIDTPADSPFPIQNLPLGVFQVHARSGPRIGTAIGDRVLDLPALAEANLLPPQLREPLQLPTLNRLAASGLWPTLRAALQALLTAETPTLRDDGPLCDRVFVPLADCQLLLPMAVGDYTDFYSSREHATNVGTMLRGADNALQPNWLHLPVAYHGRSSSLVISGTPIPRPHGQTKPADAPAPIFGPTKSLDFELEMGAFIGMGNAQGTLILANHALSHVFGLVLVNDWSARDVQGWEYVPLGPFLAKNFATTLSPWVVSLEALEPFRVQQPPQDPPVLPYLRTTGPQTWDIHLEVSLQTATLPTPHVICRSNYKHLYWSLAQQIAHHTVNGCNLQPGDLLASGTISGPTPDSYGSLMELAWRGTKPLTLPNGETRSWLQDGDRLTLTAWCQGDGYRIGFGEATGVVGAAS